MCIACSPASVRKDPGVLLNDLTPAPLLLLKLFTYLLAYYFIFLPVGWIHVISEIGLHISTVTLIVSDVCSIGTQVPCEVDIRLLRHDSSSERT